MTVRTWTQSLLHALHASSAGTNGVSKGSTLEVTNTVPHPKSTRALSFVAKHKARPKRQSVGVRAAVAGLAAEKQRTGLSCKWKTGLKNALFGLLVAGNFLTSSPSFAATHEPNLDSIAATTSASHPPTYDTLPVELKSPTWLSSVEAQFFVPVEDRSIPDGTEVRIPLEPRMLHMVELRFQDARPLKDLEFSYRTANGPRVSFRGDKLRELEKQEKEGALEIARDPDHHAPWVNNPLKVRVSIVYPGEGEFFVGNKFVDPQVHDAPSPNDHGSAEVDNISRGYESLPSAALPVGAYLRLVPVHENKKPWEGEQPLVLFWVKPIYVPDHAAREVVREGEFAPVPSNGYAISKDRPIAAVLVTWTDHGGISSGRVRITGPAGPVVTRSYNIGSGETELIPLDGATSVDGRLYIEGGSLEVSRVEVLYRAAGNSYAKLEEALRRANATSGALSDDALLEILRLAAEDPDVPANLLDRVRSLAIGPSLSEEGQRQIAAWFEIREALGPKEAYLAAKSGDVLGYRESKAEELHGANYKNGITDVFTDTDIRRGIDLTSDANLCHGPLGTTYLVDGAGSVRNLQATVQSIVEATNGPGYRVRMVVSAPKGDDIEKRLENDARATLVDRVYRKGSVDDLGRVCIDDSPQPFTKHPAGDVMRAGPTIHLNESGKFTIDYAPHEISCLAMRGTVEVRAFGATEAARKQNLRAALELLDLKDVLSQSPSQEAERIEVKLQILEQASPMAGHRLRTALEHGEKLSESKVDRELLAAKVPPTFVADAHFSNVAPGHIAVVSRSQGEAYRRAGVTAIYHHLTDPSRIVSIAKDGALLSTKSRLSIGKVVRGMSSDADLRTGGADYVFTRFATSSMKNPKVHPGVAYILFAPDVLDRVDWFGYAQDFFGTTETDDQAPISPSLKAPTRRALALNSAQPDLTHGPTTNHPQSDAEVNDHLVHLRKDHELEGHFKGRFLARATGRKGVQAVNNLWAKYAPQWIDMQTSESMVKGCVSTNQIEAILVATPEERDKIISLLREAKITEIGGRPIESMVRAQPRLFLEAPPPALKDKADELLPFYVRARGRVLG